LKFVHEFFDALPCNVVTQTHNEGIVAKERLCGFYGVRQPQGLLGDVGYVEVPLFACFDVFFDVFACFGGGYDANLVYSGFFDLIQNVAEDGFVGDGNELFGAGEG
jgi:hypothetical protein